MPSYILCFILLPTPTRARHRTRPTVFNRDLPRSKPNDSDTKRLSLPETPVTKDHLPSPGTSH